MEVLGEKLKGISETREIKLAISMGAEATLVVVTTRRSLKNRKDQKVFLGTSSICQNHGQEGEWSCLVALVSQVLLSRGQSQAGDLSQVESLVQNRLLFPKDHADICIYFPETEAQSRPEVCLFRAQKM